LVAPRIADLLALDDAQFRQLFSGSPVKRIGRDRFVRNVLIAAGNCRDDDVLPVVEMLMDDTSPVVRGAAIWAMSRLSTEIFAREKQVRFADERDPSVRAEWTLI
jgi:epoxyqueuosine reductase